MRISTAPAGRLRGRAGWLVLAVLLLAFSAFYSSLAPCGAWPNRIFGEETWAENDPGSFYVASAHELRWGASPLYVGHPGATLTPLLLGVQGLLYAFQGEEWASFTRFTAQNLRRVFLASKLLMTLLHLVSFVALYTLARTLLRDRRAATLATLGYASSLPVLYYLSRISVEPLMVAFLATAFTATWRFQERAAQGRSRAALGFAALAGACAVCGAVSKLGFLGPLPAFLGLHVLAGSSSRAAIAARSRWRALAAFTAAGAVTLGLFSSVIDWRQFYRIWFVISRATVSNTWTLADLLPGFGTGSLFLTCELAFSAVSVVGAARFLRERSDDRARALWLLAYGGFGCTLWLYRVALQGSFLPFHYFFVTQAVLAVFFGHASLALWRRVGAPEGWRAAALGAAWLGALHGVCVWAVVDSRRFDARRFAPNRGVYRLLEQLGPAERIGVERPPGVAAATQTQLVRLHGIVFPFLWNPRHSVLRETFESLFVAVRRSRAPDAERIHVPALNSDVSIASDDSAP